LLRNLKEAAKKGVMENGGSGARDWSYPVSPMPQELVVNRIERALIKEDPVRGVMPLY